MKALVSLNIDTRNNSELELTFLNVRTVEWIASENAEMSKRDRILVAIALWASCLYMHFHVSKSTPNLEVGAFHFENARTSFFPNEQNRRAIAGGSEGLDEWLRQTNIRITTHGGGDISAHCKYAAALCRSVQRQPTAAVSGHAVGMGVPPGAWVLDAAVNGVAVLNRQEQAELLQERSRLSRVSLWALYGLAFVWTTAITFNFRFLKGRT